jgi:hypothetical protein
LLHTKGEDWAMTSDTHVGLILALTVNGLAVSAYRDIGCRGGSLS